MSRRQTKNCDPYFANNLPAKRVTRSSIGFLRMVLSQIHFWSKSLFLDLKCIRYVFGTHCSIWTILRTWKSGSIFCVKSLTVFMQFECTRKCTFLWQTGKPTYSNVSCLPVSTAAYSRLLASRRQTIPGFAQTTVKGVSQNCKSNLELVQTVQQYLLGLLYVCFLSLTSRCCNTGEFNDDKNAHQYMFEIC